MAPQKQTRIPSQEKRLTLYNSIVAKKIKETDPLSSVSES